MGIFALGEIFDMDKCMYALKSLRKSNLIFYFIK